ncbi:ABC transporter ATP-binding protein [Ligilactobacillus salivarius]|uniref:ABC transporter ATP-binding protein n=2 Tax=Ligilactobacillus salivarius TaxID=1624 RepID=A0ABD7YVT4_9LACO|nr:ABC transporter ATP-binding protein [Ligilactobacillus salivarius]
MMIIPGIKILSNYFLQSVRKYSKEILWKNLEESGYFYLINHKIGNIQSYINEVSFTGRKLLQESLPEMVKALVMIVAYTLILVKSDLILGVIYIFTISSYLILSAKLSLSSRKNIGTSLKKTADVNEYWLDFYNNKDTIFSIKSQDIEYEIFKQKLDDEYKIYFDLQKKINRATLFQQGYIVTMAIGIIFIAMEKMTASVSLSTILILIYSIINLTNFGSKYLEIFELLDRMKAGLRKLNYPLKKTKDKKIEFLNDIDRIEFDHLSFKYPNNTKYILNDLSINLPKKKLIAITGANGKGKSTLLKILSGLLPIQDGSIKIPSDLNEIMYLDQDSSIFNRSVIENINYPKQKADLEQIEQLFRKFKLKINILTDKRTVGEMKKSLSGGEQQKILILRMIVQKPKLVLLDEVTSNLDTESSKIFYKLLRKYLSDTTVIAVIHKQNELVYFDEVLNLDSLI